MYPRSKLLIASLLATLWVSAPPAYLYSQGHRSTVTFDNRSGAPASVKLIGPTGQTIEVPNGQRRTVNVSAGEYEIFARYGSKSKEYSYSRGELFTVNETATQYSAITITLHKVVGGNYPTRTISAAGDIGNKKVGRHR